MEDAAEAVVTRAGVHPVLVMGATGRVGRAVVAELLGAGVPVRALTRRPATAELPATVESWRATSPCPSRSTRRCRA
jgi:nucleoside-diphosphate-sugar epimerase